MKTAPDRGAKDNLNLLTTRQTTHSIVQDEFRVEAKVSKVLLDLTTDEGTEETKTPSLTSVNFEVLLL